MDDFNPGDPIDLRDDEQRHRAAQGPFGDSELRAARVLARLTGEKVTLQDDSRTARTPDVRIDYADGRVACAEVAVDTDRCQAALYEEIRRRQFALDSNVPLRRTWIIGLSKRTKVKALQRELPQLLAQLENDGQLFEEYMHPEQFAALPSPAVRELLRLGVYTINSWPPRDDLPGPIVIRPEGMGGPVRVAWPEFAHELDALLVSPLFSNKLEKLRAAEADERHLFVGTSPSTPWPLNWALDSYQHELPPVAPHLPFPLTHLWLMGMWPPFRCITFDPSDGWRDVVDHWATP